MQYKKYLPSREQLLANKALKAVAHLIAEPNLWHFNRHSVSFATLIGIFCCFLPIPFQMIPCVFLVSWVRCNLPLAIALVWVSNPVTMPPMMYFTYRIGTTILGEPNKVEQVHISLEWLAAQLGQVWQPLLLGSLLTGGILGLTGFIIVRIYWRWKVSRNWSMRKLRKKMRRKSKTAE